MKSITLGLLVCTICVALGGCASSLNTKAHKEDAVEFRKAADQGNAEAQYDLGLCYEVGSGVPEDEVEAVKWYRKAAEQGHAEAQTDLGRCYNYGRGVKEDAVEAVKWYRKAAKQRNTTAIMCLGDCFKLGDGMPEDIVEAYAFYNLAGTKAAIQSRDRVAKKMKPEQIAAAKKRTKELEKEFKK